MIRSFIVLILSTFFISTAFGGTTTAVETRSEYLSSTIVSVGDRCVNYSFRGLYDIYSYASNFSFVRKEISRKYLVNVVTKTSWTGKKQVTETMVPESSTIVAKNASYESGAQGLDSYATASECISKRDMYESMIGQSID